MAAFFKGFVCAAKGVLCAIKEERNLRFDICAAFYVYLFSIFYHFSRQQYVLLTLVVFGVLALEIINSAIERTVDGLMPAYNKLAGTIKDISAGAVLVFCIGAVFCGVWLFWDLNTFFDIFLYFSTHLPLLAALLASFGLAGWWVFAWGRQKPGKAQNAAKNAVKHKPENAGEEQE